ncbi:MAG: carboxyl transferase domain-containing protein [Henriciella sp.]|nr:carboxyl transferase domain-containing protein [Henriciella sp.]
MKRLLIANRGEIAIRLARSAAEAGLETLGLRSEDDATSLHTRRMDDVIALTGRGPSAYLDIAQIVAVAQSAGADAVHPGYGFLSENTAFAEAVEAAGLIFVGPKPETLALFGDKTRALQCAQDLDVPTLSSGARAVSLSEAEAAFTALPKGQHLMLKAVAGGGGRGVRVVQSPKDLPDAFERAASEAKAAFGDSSLYAERYLPKARHVEIQVIGDGTGAISHLWDRDCTLQRRHQKILEIAPSPNLCPSVRDTLCEAALKLAAHVRYRGVGTFEFLIDPLDQSFYFIEANARLQVEHTVTEAILGIDLVRAQLAIAGGQTLEEIGLRQADIPEPNGFAIQARINLETLNADGTIRPGGGTLVQYQPPSGPGIRVDHYGYAGYQTNPAFDSLLAKLIAHVPGGAFPDALKRLDLALAAFDLEGAPSTIPMHRALIAVDDVQAYKVHTRYIDEHAEALSVAANQATRADPLAVLNTDETHPGAIAQSPLPAGLHAVNAPMQGTIVSLSVAPGEAVSSGSIIAIMEAMKMEHEIRADASGLVHAIDVTPGETVFEGHRLLSLSPQDVEAGDAQTTQTIDLDHIRPDLQEALDRIAAGHDENRPDAVAKRKGRGHRTARENIADLCDDDSFVEYGATVLAAQRKRRSMDDLIANTTGDGMVCGLGHVNGDQFPEEKSRVMAMTYDYMVLAGTQGALNHYKKDRMFEIARHQRLPTIVFTEGGGGRPGDTDVTGVGGLDCLAFNYFAQLSGLVPTIGIVNGRCFAGNAVLLGCCDVIIATESSNIGIGGPAMIEGGGLGVFKPEEVGPIQVQVENGVVDIAVKDEAEAVAAAKRYLSYFQGPIDTWEAPDARELRFVVPENRLRWYDMRKVIEGIADIGSVLELRAGWSPGIITSFIRVEGRPVGVIANNPSHLGGAIDSPGADKGARFLQLCDAFDIPVLTLIDCPGIMVGPEIEKTALVRHASRMMVVGANIDTPLISVVIRKGYGLGAQAMAGGSFRAPLMIVTWPTGEFGGMGLEGAVKLGFRKELEAIKDPDERQKTYEEMVARSYERGKAVNMASHFELDDVIDPADTRQRIMAALKSLPPKPVRTDKGRKNVDTW